MKKNSTKSLLACAVLASVMSVGTMAEAADTKVWVGNGDGAAGTNWKGAVMTDSTSPISGACTAGANLFLDGTGSHDGIAISDVNYFYAGYGSGNGTATGNSLTITDGSYGEKKYFYGGHTSGSGAVTGNNLTINGGVFGKKCEFYGGYSRGSGAVTGNTLTINAGSFDYPGVNVAMYWLAGGFSNGSGDVTGNTLKVYGGSFTGDIYAMLGGLSWGAGRVDNNTVIIDGVRFVNTDNIEGGHSGSDGAGAYGNTVIIKNSPWMYCYIFGGFCENAGDATGNRVIIENSLIKNNVKGGSSHGNANNNEVRITGGAVLSITVYGGETNAELGGDSACNNKVIFTDTKVDATYVNGGAGGGDAISNTVIFTNVTATGSGITGGYSANGDAIGNLVEIKGGSFGSGSSLLGGVAPNGTSADNTLNLNIKINLGSVGWFQNMNFILPTGFTKDDAMITTTDVCYKNTKIAVDAALGVNFQKGDVVTLIAADTLTGDSSITNEGASALFGAGIIQMDGNNLVVKVLKDFSSDDYYKAPVEGVAAAAATVNASADLASGEGMASLVANTADGGTDTFGAMSAGNSKYKTGSHVDVKGWGMLVGAGTTKEWENGQKTTYGLFFEYGKGDFDTYNGNVHGDGNSKNQGVGIMARHKMLDNTYYEGNIRFGKQKTEWGESGFGGYETDSRYYGIMVGVGHIFPIGKNELDVYGRYMLGRVAASDATVGGYEYHFDSVKSYRIRVGGKYNFVQKNSKAKPFIGLAWEHEFKGEARASISGVGEAPAPSMKGHTGIMEVGCDWKVSKKWTVGLGANAYMGKRKGWDGMARVFYNF